MSCVSTVPTSFSTASACRSTRARGSGSSGANGSGKSTLLRILGGLEQPDSGTIVREPATLTAGYLPQEHAFPAGRVGRSAPRAPDGHRGCRPGARRAAEELAAGRDAGERYSAALDRFLALGGGDLETRAATVLAELGLPVGLDRPVEQLSGGEAARLALAAILLSRYDVLLLDEPTNDLDFDGLERLERFVATTESALVVVSHDRAFLDRTVTRIAEIEDGRGRVREFAGGWTEYAAARDAARSGQYERFEEAQERRQELSSLLNERRNQARAGGGMADRRGTHALMTKVRQAERLLERNELPREAVRALAAPARAQGGNPVRQHRGPPRRRRRRRGDFTLGPIDLDLVPGRAARRDRAATAAASRRCSACSSASSRSNEGARDLGRTTVIGTIGQERVEHGETLLLDAFVETTGLATVDARTLLAKFGLGADHVGRPWATLSPGERTRAHLAELQAREVNLLVLDEPTNHLDLEAVEQLEQALRAYDGTLVVVTHDRTFLDAIEPTRELAL